VISEQDQASLQQAVDIANAQAQREDFRSDLARAMRSDIGDGIQDRSGFTLSDQDSRALSRASSEVVSAQETLSRVDSDTQGWESRKSISNLAIVNALGADEIQRVATTRGVWGLAESILARSYQPLAARRALTLDQAAGLAGLDALRSSWTIRGRDAGQTAGDAEALFGLAQRSGLGAPGPQGDPGRNAGLEVPDVSGVRARAEGVGGTAGLAAGVRGAVAADRADREGLAYSGPELVDGPTGQGAYRPLAEQDAAAARVDHLQRMEALQYDQIGTMLLRAQAQEDEFETGRFLRGLFAEGDPRLASAVDAGGSLTERTATIAERARELGLTEAQANYAAGMMVADGATSRAAARNQPGLDPQEARALDAWMEGGGNQYLDRLRALNQTRAEKEALIRAHDLVPGDPGQAPRRGLDIEITRGRP
jgi:hypothetical protein